MKVIPKVKLHLAGELGDQVVIDLDKKTVFYDFVGIHDFVGKMSWPTRIQYYIEVSTYFLALAPTKGR